MDTPEAHGSSRKLEMAPTHLESEYLLGKQCYNFGLAYQTPLRGHTGSPRKLTDAKNGIIPYAPNISWKTVLELRVAVPDNLKWTHQNPTEAQRTTRKIKIENNPENPNISCVFSVRTSGSRTRPHTWKRRKTAESHGSSRKLEIA